MAEIELERRRRAGWWPWIVGLVALIAVVWVLAEAFGDDDEVITDTTAVELERGPEPGPTAAAPAAETLTPEDARERLPESVREFRETCVGEQAGPAELGLQHEHTARCMELAAAALDAAVRVDTVGSLVLEQELEAFRSNAQELRESGAEARTHAPLVARSMASAADLVGTLHEERHAADLGLRAAAERLREISGEVDPDVPLLEQRERVHSFFTEMERALRAIAEGSPAA